MYCASCGAEFNDRAVFCPGCGQRITIQRRTPAAAGARRAAANDWETNGAGYGRPSAAPPPAAPAVSADELRATIGARAELGERMEPELIDAFIGRIERRIDERVESRLRGRMPVAPGRRGRHGQTQNLTGRLAATLGLGIPLTAIAGGVAHADGVVAVWFGMVALNVFYTWAELRSSRE